MNDSPRKTALSEADWAQLPSHPRLLASDARFAALRAQSDPVSLQLKDLLRQQAEHLLETAPETYPADGEMGAGRPAQRRIIALAMWFRLSGEARALEQARRDLRQLAARPNWGTHHFLDVGEAGVAAGLALDWLYDYLSPEERESLADAIAARALVPSLDAQEGVGSFIDAEFNWNQVCNAGLLIAALAIAEREPELSRRIVDRAVKFLPNATRAYAPDGSYPEGPLYWSYGTSHHVLAIEALRSAFGSTCGLERAPGFLESAEFALQVRAPSGEAYDFSDSQGEGANEPILLWFARETGRRELADPELQIIAKRAALSSADLGGARFETFRFHRHFALELGWWNPNLPAAGAPLPLHWTAGGHSPLAVMRSAWGDERATWLAIKGGTSNYSHGHMDGGSFVLEADGVRWAIDPGREDYDLMRAAKLDLWNYGQQSSRWTTFRAGPEGHNIPRFNGAAQRIEGHATIRELDGGAVGNLADLSSLYRGQVAQIERRVELLPDGSVTIEDRWTTGERAVRYAFQWLTRAQTSQIPGGLRLEQAGESLELQIEAPVEFHIEIEDVSESKATQDSPNPGLSRIAIRQFSAADSRGFLRVKAVPGGGV